MTTSIEDNELNVELQELYLTGRQWLADLDFFENEIIFLMKVCKTAIKLPDQHEFTERLSNLRCHYEALKTDTRKLINAWGILTVASEKKIELSLLEDHIQLKLKIEDLLQTYQEERKAIFALSIVRNSVVKSGKKKYPLF